MTAIPATTASALADYDSLIAFVTDHLQLDSDTAGKLPTLLRMAESELERQILSPKRETTATLSATSATVALPTDFEEMRSILLVDYWPLSLVTLNVLQSAHPTAAGPGLPQVYAISGSNLILGPSPDATYSLSATYLATLTGLSATNATNWLLTKYPDAYVYALMFQAEAYRNNDDRLPGIRALMGQVIDQINKQGNRNRVSTPIRLRSPGVVV